MPKIVSFHDGFLRTTAALRLLLGREASAEDPKDPILFEAQFGFYGHSISIHRAHLEYLADVNAAVDPVMPEFDADVISRWHVVNTLLSSYFGADAASQPLLVSEFPALA